MKKFIVLAILLTVSVTSINWIVIKHPQAGKYPTMEELDAKYKKAWDKPEYAAANAAVNEPYLTDMEKRIFYYLNLARMNPPLFAMTYASGYKGANGYANNDGFDENEASLIAELRGMKKLSVLHPSKRLFGYAKCQAVAIGKSGHSGMEVHNRQATGCPMSFAYGENINFGEITALDVIMSWLNDAGNVLGNNQMGHRANCLRPTFDSMAVSVQPHKEYGKCMVMDLTSK